MVKFSRHIFSPYFSFWEKCLNAFLGLLLLIVVGLFGLLIFFLIDSAGIPSVNKTITVVEVKQIVPAHTTFILVGKVILPQYHSESYELYFKINGEKVSSSVEKKLFDEINVGEKIEVHYGCGRLSNSPKPTRIRLIG